MSRPVYAMGGFGFIGLDTFKTYIDLFGIPGMLDIDEFRYMIAAMDSEFMRIESARAKQRSSKGRK